SGDFWQHMFQNLMDGIAEPLVIASDTTDLIYHSNLAFQALTGLSEEVVHGMPWTALHPIPKRSVNSLDEFETEIILPRRKGEPVSAIVHCKPLVDQPEKVLAIYYPVPSELVSESEVSPKSPPLSATEPSLPVWQLLHDLKTPLSAVKGFSQLILDRKEDTLPEDVVHFARRINHNGLLLEQLLDDLQHRRNQVERQPSPAVPISRVMQQVADNVAFLLEKYPVTVDMPETWPVIPGYELDLVRLWTNILINAIRCVSSSTAPVVRLTWQPADGGYRFGIFNNGPAIPEKEQPHIFNAAFEKTVVNAGMDANWGVGLSIVHTIVQQHLGRVWVESRPDQGVHFYFILPAGKTGARQEN
ncbi:PAS domain-containing sensor histidine kinase, partial [bacterium]|nr:PAS domain-containing sensor histidine kinase [bacterium]